MAITHGEYKLTPDWEQAGVDSMQRPDDSEVLSYLTEYNSGQTLFAEAEIEPSALKVIADMLWNLRYFILWNQEKAGMKFMGRWKNYHQTDWEGKRRTRFIHVMKHFNPLVMPRWCELKLLEEGWKTPEEYALWSRRDQEAYWARLRGGTAA